MPNFPVRNLGGAGVISDIHPYDLPPNAFSAGVNVRFENGKISRAPTLLTVHEFSDDTFAPSFMFQIPAIGSLVDSLVCVNSDVTQLTQVTGSTEADVTHPSASPVTLIGSMTATFLGSVTYLNNNAMVPLYKRTTDSTFAELPGWDPEWRCKSLRAYKDFLVALNVTKDGVEYPSMVKWPDITPFGDAPGSWDSTLTTNSAGENILNEMKDGLVDGMSLRDSFILYGETEVWQMDYVGGAFLFNFRKLYDNTSIMSANCVAEVDGVHYVFGRNDIYAHDGVTKRSILHGVNKDFVFSGLLQQLRELCFVTVDTRLNEIHFCYPSQDHLVGFLDPTTGCNRAAVYNYQLQTWTFYDLPNVVASAPSTVSTTDTFTSVPDVTYDDMGGSFIGSEGLTQQYTVYAGLGDATQGLTASRLYGLDRITGGTLAKPIATEAIKDAFLERVGIDLDEDGLELTQYKCVQALYPQLGLQGDTPVYFQLGASDIVGSEPLWGTLQSYDPTTDNKIDGREAGRYLAWRMYYSGLHDFALSGFDAKVTIRGRR